MLLRKVALCSLSLVLGLWALPGTLAAQDEEVGVGSYEHFEFWYRTAAPVLFDPEGEVIRDVIPSNEYEERKRQIIQSMLVPMYSGLLSGDTTLAISFGFSEEVAPELARLDPEIEGRVKDNPENAAEMAQKMAEWAFFYQQYDFWNRYVAESIIREELGEDEIISFVPQDVSTEHDAIYQALVQHADLVRQAEETRYASMIDVISANKASQLRYENFLEDQTKSTISFAANWGHQYDGTQFSIGDTTYLVRSIEDRPENPEEDFMKDTLPRNGILLEVPKGKFVTPYDLINEDGSIKQPQRN